MVIETYSEYLEALGSFGRVSKLSKTRKCSAELSFVVFSFDFDKTDTLWSSVIKTYQSESVQARISYSNKLAQHFNGLKQRHISIAQAYISTVDWQDVLHNPSEFRNGLHNLSEARVIEGPLFLIL